MSCVYCEHQGGTSIPYIPLQGIKLHCNNVMPSTAHQMFYAFRDLPHRIADEVGIGTIKMHRIIYKLCAQVRMCLWECMCVCGCVCERGCVCEHGWLCEGRFTQKLREQPHKSELRLYKVLQRHWNPLSWRCIESAVVDIHEYDSQ